MKILKQVFELPFEQILGTFIQQQFTILFYKDENFV